MVTDYPTGTVTLVFTDIQDSSLLSERYGAAFEPIRAAHFRLIRDTLADWRGYEVSTTGDSAFLVFADATDAVRWAVEVQTGFLQTTWRGEADTEPPMDLRVRIGMNTGEPFLASDPTRPDYFGPPVNRASRIAAAGHGGQILLSSTTQEQVAAQLAPPLELLDCGQHRLKGVGEERLWQILHPDLSRDFPPLRTLNPERHNLPIQETPYIGREEEVRSWQQLLIHPTTRLLTFTGFGGMGKTRSALHLAELSIEMFEHGVWWIELEEARTGEEMIRNIAAALNIPLLPSPTVREQLHIFLREKQLLLLLDNSEQLTDAAEVLHELLNAAPNLKCLVTSRRALELRAETVIEIRPLPEVDAERLFVERARTFLDSFSLSEENLADIQELCRRLEGVPLAIELAAARIVGMTPRQMLARLSERFRLLQTRAPDLPPRQRALRAAIDWSYDLLTGEQRHLFAQLAVFSGGFTMEDAEEICTNSDVFESILELRRHSLFRTETDSHSQASRFVMLDSLREYAMERLQEFEDGEDEIRQRHARYFLKFARETVEKFRTPDEITALRQLEVNQANLRSAADWAKAGGQILLFAELALLIGITLQRRGFRADAVRPVQAGLDSLEQTRMTETSLYARLLLERAALHYELDAAMETARGKAQAASQKFQTHEDLRGLARCENLIGLAALKEQDYQTAREQLKRALEYAEKAGDTIQIAIIHNNLGLVERRDTNTNQPERALFHLHEALRLRRILNDRRGLAETLNNLGVLLHIQNDFETAWQYYTEALPIEQTLRHAYGVALVLNNLGEIASARDRDYQACRLFAASERIMEDVKSPDFQYVTEQFSQALAKAPNAEASRLRQSVRGKTLEELIAWATLEAERDETVETP